MRSGAVFAKGNGSNPCTENINALENTANFEGWTPWSNGKARASIGRTWIGSPQPMQGEGTQPEVDAVESVKVDLLNPTVHYGGPGKTVPVRVALIGKTKDHGVPLRKISVDVHVEVPSSSGTSIAGETMKRTVSVGGTVSIATFDVPAAWFQVTGSVIADVRYAFSANPTDLTTVGNVTMIPQDAPSAPDGMTQWLEAELPYSDIYQGHGKMVIDVYSKTSNVLTNLDGVIFRLDGGGSSEGGSGVSFAEPGVVGVNTAGMPWTASGKMTESKDQIAFLQFRTVPRGKDPRDANGRELIMRVHLNVPSNAKVGSYGLTIQVKSDTDTMGRAAISAYSNGGAAVQAIIDGRLSLTTSKPSIFVVADEVMAVSPTFDGTARIVNTAVLDEKENQHGLKVHTVTSKAIGQILRSGSGLACTVDDGVDAISINADCSNLRTTSAHTTGGKTTITVKYKTFSESQTVNVWYPDVKAGEVKVNAWTGGSVKETDGSEAGARGKELVLYKVTGWTDSCGGTTGQRYTSMSFNSMVNFEETIAGTCEEKMETECDYDNGCEEGWTKIGDDSWFSNSCWLYGNEYCQKCSASETAPRHFWDSATDYLEWTVDPPNVAQIVVVTDNVPASSAGRMSVEGLAPGDAALVGSRKNGVEVVRVPFEVSSKTVSAVALHSYAVRVEDIEATVSPDGVCVSVAPEAPSLKFERDKVQVFSTVELQCDEDASPCGYLDVNVNTGLVIESLNPKAITVENGNVITVPLMAEDAALSSLVKTTWDPAGCAPADPSGTNFGLVRSCAELEVALPPADRMTVALDHQLLAPRRDSAFVAGIKTETDVTVTFFWDADENGKGARQQVMSGDPRLVVDVTNSGGRVTAENKGSKLTLTSTEAAPIGDADFSISFTHSKLFQNTSVKIVHFEKFIVSAVPDPQSCAQQSKRITSVLLSKINGTTPRTFQRAKVTCEMQLSDGSIRRLDRLSTKPTLHAVGGITLTNSIATPTEFGTSKVFCDFAYNQTAEEDALKVNSLDSVRVKAIKSYTVAQGSTALSSTKALRGGASQADAQSCLQVILSDDRCYGASTRFCSPFDSASSDLPGIVNFSSDSDAATVDEKTGVVSLIKNGLKDATITATFNGADLKKSVTFAANLDPRTAGDVDLGQQDGLAIPALTVGQTHNLPVRVNTNGFDLSVFDLYLTYEDDIKPLLNGMPTINEENSAVILEAECDKIAVSMFSGALRIYGTCKSENKVTNGKPKGDKNGRWANAGVHFVTVKLKALKVGVPALFGRTEGMTDAASSSTLGPAIEIGGRPFIAGDFSSGKGRRSVSDLATIARGTSRSLQQHASAYPRARRQSGSLAMAALVPGDADLGSYKELVDGQSGRGRVNLQDLVFMMSMINQNELCILDPPLPSFNSDTNGCCYLEDAAIDCTSTLATGFDKVHADVYTEFAAAAVEIAGAEGPNTRKYYEEMMDLNYDGIVDSFDADQLLFSLSGQRVLVQQPPGVEGLRGSPVHFTEPSNTTDCQLVGRTSMFLSAGTNLFNVASGESGTALKIEDMVAVHAIFADPSDEFAEIMNGATSRKATIDVIAGEGAIVSMLVSDTINVTDSNGDLSGIYVNYEFGIHSTISSANLNKLGTKISATIAVRKPDDGLTGRATVDYIPMQTNHKRPLLKSEHLNGWARDLRLCKRVDELDCIYDTARGVDGRPFPSGIGNSTYCWVPCDLTRFMEVSPADPGNPPDCVPTFTTTETSTASSTASSTRTSSLTSTATSTETSTATSTQSRTASSTVTSTATGTATTATSTGTSTITSTGTSTITSTATSTVVMIMAIAPEEPVFPLWAVILGALLFLLLVILTARQLRGTKMLIFPFAPRVMPPKIGNCKPGKKLKITCETDEVDIYFTVDGSKPGKNSNIFRMSTAPKLTAEFTVVKAIAVCQDYAARPSSVSERSFNDNGINKVEPNKFEPETIKPLPDEVKPKPVDPGPAMPATLGKIEPNAGYANMHATIDISNLRLSEDIVKVTLAGIKATVLRTEPPVSASGAGGYIEAPEDDDSDDDFDLDDMTSSSAAGTRLGFYKSVTVEVGMPKETPQTGNVVITTASNKTIRGEEHHPVVWQYKPVGIASVAPTRGYSGTEVTIYGHELLRGSSSKEGGSAELKEVRLAGIPAKIVGTPSDIMITVVAGGSKPDTGGPVELEFESGNITTTEATGMVWMYNPTGKIKGVKPERGAAGAEVSITGVDLMCGGKSVSVTFGGVLVHRIVRQTARSITVVVPDRDVGKCDVVITPDTGGELYAISAPYAFTQLESAVITDMSPTFGCVGQVVEITGTNLLGDAADFRKITLAGIEADYKPRSGSQTSLTVRAREGPQGRSGPLVLQTTDGTTITGTYDWRYTSSVQLESITPNRGQTGTRAVLRGTNLLGGSKDSVKVTLGGCTVGKVVSQSNEEIVVIAARRGIFGKCDVEILTGSGERGKIVSGWEQLKDAFIEAADPVAGIKDTVVNIKGTNLLAGGNDLVEVTLAGIKAEYVAGSGTNTAVQVVARTAIPDTKGPIKITTESGIEVFGPQFTYKPHTYIDKVTPPRGVAGNVVVIEGKNMAGGKEHGGKITKVMLAGTEVAKILLQMDDTVTVVVGKSTSLGVGDVVITNDSQKTITLKDGWTDVASGTITSATPAFGKGGTMVEIKGVNLLCGGTDVKSVTLAGVEARLAPGLATEQSVTVVAAHADPGTIGPICITSDSGASVPSDIVWRYGVEPSLTKATPSSGQAGTTVVLSGKNLLGTGKRLKSVTLGGVPVLEIVEQSSSTVTVVADNGNPGPGEIVVTAETGESCSLAGGWELVGEGFIDSITPSSGVGGTAVVIEGQGLRSIAGIDVTQVTLNGVPVNSFKVVSDEKITAVVGPSSPGHGAVVLTATHETLVSGPNVIWTYLTESSITGLEPDRGQPGTYVDILGKGLLCGGNQVSVKIGGLSAVVEEQRESSILLMSPDGPPGKTVDVVVTADTGESVSMANAFTFEAIGTVTSISPAKGPPGTEVTITGSRLLGGGANLDKLLLAGSEAKIVTATDDVITVIVGEGPPGLAGLAAIISDSGAIVESNANTLFVYTAPNAITAASPSSGIEDDVVVISGVGLLGDGSKVAKVTLAGRVVKEILSESDREIKVVVGAGNPGRGDIVITLDNRDESVKKDAWEHLPFVSSITSIVPSAGMTGAKVTITGKHLLANGNTFTPDSVTLNGVPVSKVESFSEEYVTVIAGNSRPDAGLGDVVVKCTNGEQTVLKDAWTHLKDGVIQNFTPTGFFDEEVVIEGKGLLGGGKDLFRVFLAGVEAQYVVGTATDTRVTVKAGKGKQHKQGVVRLECTSGVTLESIQGVSGNNGLFLYTFDIHESKRHALDNDMRARNGTFTLDKQLRSTKTAFTAADVSEPPKEDIYFRADAIDADLRGLSFAGSGVTLAGLGGGGGNEGVTTDGAPRSSLVFDDGEGGGGGKKGSRSSLKKKAKKKGRGGSRREDAYADDADVVIESDMIESLKKMFAAADVEGGTGFGTSKTAPDEHLSTVEMAYRVDSTKLVELLKATGAIKKLGKDKGVRTIFKKMDSDNDGKVSMGEFIAFATTQGDGGGKGGGGSKKGKKLQRKRSFFGRSKKVKSTSSLDSVSATEGNSQFIAVDESNL